MLWIAVTLAAFCLAVVVAPAHRTLSGRFAVVTIVVALLASLSYAIPYAGRPPRLVLVLGGVLAGALVLAARAPRARRLPTVGMPEVGTAVFASVALWWWRPLLTWQEPVDVVARLTRRGDNGGHFSMTEYIRLHQSQLHALPDAARDAYTFGWYPTTYHAIAASLMEVLGGPGTDMAREPVLYAHALALILILSVTALTAWCVAATVRSGPSAIVGVAVSVALLGAFWFVTRTGAGLAAQSWGNFVLGCAAAGMALISVGRLATRARSADLVVLTASLTLVVGVWPPLALGPALCVLVLAVRCALHGAEGRRRAGGLTLASLAAIALSWPAIRSTLAGAAKPREVPFHLVPGSVTPDPPWVPLTAIALALALTVAARNRPSRVATSGALRWSGVAVLVPPILLLVLMGADQLRATGSLQYYWFKVAAHAMLLSFLLIGCLLAERTWSMRDTFAWTSAALILSIAAVLTAGPGLYTRGNWTTPVNDIERSAAAEALRAARILDRHPDDAIHLETRLLEDPAPTGESIDANSYAFHWTVGLTGRDRSQAIVAVNAAYAVHRSPQELARYLRTEHPDLVILVRPGRWAEAFRAEGLTVIEDRES